MNSLLLQLFVNGVVSGSSILALALGLGIYYRISGYFNFAYGIYYTLSAYLTILFINKLGISILLSSLISVSITIIIGHILEVVIFNSLRRRNASPMIYFIASMGLYIVLQNIISIIFGDEIKSIGKEVVAEGIDVYGAKVTIYQILIILSSVIIVIMTWLGLNLTKMGKSIKAVASDPLLAQISGIDSNKIIYITNAITVLFASISGILISYDIEVTPTMGLNCLMLSVVAVIIGGIGSIPGLTLGAFFIGLSQNYGVWKIGTQWQDSIVFVILIIFLFIRPQGIYGKIMQKSTV